MPQEKFTNSLIHESSPYLLQHAHNPVNWLAWGDQAFESAQTQNKLVIISIGYSACHWCHVMEHQTFEDSGAADLMNKHFISIKVDREERPDVDQIYMTALQLMTGRGGWPLNIIALPDGRPVWGGTYLPKENWMEVLRNIADMYKNEPEKINDYAENLTAGVRQTELVQLNTADADFKTTDADFIFANWQKNFDTTEGGMSRAPKFPLPNNYEYLLQYGHLTGNEHALKHVRLTLFKMAGGGIYDHIGGGFARYSVDDKWVAPHFEKMLYDNAQLVSLYAQAYQKFKAPLYAKIVHETLEWLQREMTGPDGEFYSALDADSEGEEGKFYVWTESELRQIIPAGNWEYFEKYYDLKKGQWEGKIILLRNDFEVASANAEIWEERERRWKELLFQKRSSRIRPGLDDKSLTSWNAMMITALVNANHLSADHFSENEYLNRAIKTADWLLNKQVRKDNSLYHSYRKGRSSINGFIEDYAFGIEAFLKLFEATFDEKYLTQATKWMDYAKQNFEDPTTSLFYTRCLKGKQLISKSLETTDNVIPASNSVMAKNLFTLSHYLDKTAYHIQAEKMLNQMNKERLLQYGDNYSNWAQLLLRITYPYYEIAISGKSAGKKYRELKTHYIPNAVFIGSANESSLPLLEKRYVKGETYIYVCREKVCQLPVKETDRALEEIKL